MRGNIYSENPKVTVLMAVYNGEKHLKEAVDSILSQTFYDYEFIIVDDGSSDASKEIVKSFSDSRIKLIENTANIGLAESLNLGLREAKGDYIVRMDADDISHKQRIAKQVSFMDVNEDIGVAGTGVYTIDEAGTLNDKIVLERDPEIIRCGLLFRNKYIFHPSVIMRKSFIDKHLLLYTSWFFYSQDTELWSRCADLFKLSNLEDPLLYYRVSTSKVLDTDKAVLKRKYAKEIAKRNLHKMNALYSDARCALHVDISNAVGASDLHQLRTKRAWLQYLVDTNKGNIHYEESAFLYIIGQVWLNNVAASRALGVKVFVFYLVSGLTWKSGFNRRVWKRFLPSIRPCNRAAGHF